MNSFKDTPGERALTPSGYWVVVRPLVGEPGWGVWVYDFAMWKHRRLRFPDETSARGYFAQWLL